MTHTLTEILTQPAAWQSALREAERVAPEWRRLLEDRSTPMVFTGCGSTWYLAEIAAALFRRLSGRQTLLFLAASCCSIGKTGLETSASVLVHRWWLSAVLVRLPKPCALYRPGAPKAGKRWSSRIIPIPSGSLADAALLLPEGREESVAQTRSFASMLVGLNALAALVSSQRTLWEAMQQLPAAAERLIARCQSLAQSLGEDRSLERFYFLGSGLRYGLAREASLKMKEMSAQPQ